MCAKRAKQSFYAAQTARGIRSRVVPYGVQETIGEVTISR